MKQLLLLLFLLPVTMFVKAQNGTISGRITDSTYKKPFALATITVFRAIDTSIITYRLSDEKGSFKVPGLPLNVPLRFTVSYSGHSTYRKEFELTSSYSQLQFDTILLKPIINELEEVVLVSERPPVTIKNDTIEFNASAFKTLPNALVEDLLKKLPGVQVDADGNIMVNGKSVNRILVDGKSFFGDDPKMASRNLPANIIDKVQVTDDKDQQMMTGTLNPNEIGKVVNITLKKGIKKGWFGKLYAGAGTNDVYEAGGIANIYRDTLQLSALGYANNLNKAGFNIQDLTQTGGLSRSMNVSSGGSTSISSSGVGSNVNINGVNFGGQSGTGVTTSKGAGFNLNHTPNTKRSFFAQYFYGNSAVDRQVQTDVSQYFKDTIINNLNHLKGNASTNSHNIGIGLRMKPDSVTNLTLNASYALGLTDESRLSTVTSKNNKLGNLSLGNISQSNDINTYAYRHSLNFVKLSRTKKGRRFNISQGLDLNNRRNNYLTQSEVNQYYPVSALQLLNQSRRDSVPRVDANLFANYSEPITKTLTLKLSSQLEYGQNKNDIGTYGQNVSGKYDSMFNQFSSNLKRQTGRSVTSLSVDYKLKDLTLTPIIRYIWQGSEVQTPYLSKPFTQSSNNLVLGLSLIYKQWVIFYDEGIVLPGYQYLIATTNNSDPYFITKPNPDLRPSTRHVISMNYRINNLQKNLFIFLSGQSIFTKNDIVDDIVIDDHGVQTTTPVNADGSNTAMLNYNINKQYKYSSKFTLTTSLGGYQRYTKNRLFFNNTNSWQNTYSLSSWATVGLNWNDKFEWTNYYQLNNNFTRYSISQFTNLNLTSYDISTSMILRYPKHVIWETSFALTRYATTSPRFPSQVARWNAGINFTMLKDERGVLSLKAYDLLNQNNYVTTAATRNMITITSSNVLPRYFMATFTYNVQALGASKRKVGGSLFNF